MRRAHHTRYKVSATDGDIGHVANFLFDDLGWAVLLFFRNHFWERLMVNVGIVLVFWAFYLRFLKRP